MEKRHLTSLLSGLVLGGCSVFGIRSGTEQPPYTVVDHLGTVEIRAYGARSAAETTVTDDEDAARSDGFRKLARYIFGHNEARRSIEMTAPVAQAPDGQQIAMSAPVGQAAAAGGAWTIRFFLPASLTTATAPRPLDPSIHLVEVPPATMAVLRFSGIPRPAVVAAEREQLLAAIKTSPMQAVGEPVTWFYDPPWTLPPLRRNEVAVEVRQK